MPAQAFSPVGMVPQVRRAVSRLGLRGLLAGNRELHGRDAAGVKGRLLGGRKRKGKMRELGQRGRAPAPNSRLRAQRA